LNSFDDLVVGAPLFVNIVGNQIGQDEGRVYAFMNDGNGKVHWKQYCILFSSHHSRPPKSSLHNHLNPLTAEVFSKVKEKKIVYLTLAFDCLSRTLYIQSFFSYSSHSVKIPLCLALIRREHDLEQQL